MIDRIIQYPHPTLRRRSPPVTRVDDELKAAVARMFQLMYEAKGVGLAANQVNLPLRLFVLNTAREADEGQEYVFINPVIQRATGSDEQEEGCLSLPGLYANVHRSTNVRVEAYDLSGEKITMDTAGLMARAIQHEIDHLDGVLFIDRLSDIAKAAVRHKIEEFEADAAMRIRTGTAEEMDEIERRWQEIEDRYCQ